MRGTTANVAVREFLQDEGIDLSKFKGIGKFGSPVPIVRRKLKRMLGKNYLSNCD